MAMPSSAISYAKIMQIFAKQQCSFYLNKLNNKSPHSNNTTNLYIEEINVINKTPIKVIKYK